MLTIEKSSDDRIVVPKMTEPLATSLQLYVIGTLRLSRKLTSIHLFSLFVETIQKNCQKLVSIMLVIAKEIVDMSVNIIFEFLCFLPKNWLVGCCFL